MPWCQKLLALWKAQNKTITLLLLLFKTVLFMCFYFPLLIIANDRFPYLNKWRGPVYSLLAFIWCDQTMSNWVGILVIVWFSIVCSLLIEVCYKHKLFKSHTTINSLVRDTWIVDYFHILETSMKLSLQKLYHLLAWYEIDWGRNQSVNTV